jgi:peroxiredoxin Q/BCP
MLNIGDQAPDFELPDADMTIAKSADYRGKPLVLFFYVRDDTPGCTTEAIEFSDLDGDFARLGCAVVGVSRDDCIRHGAFRDKHGITVRLLADKDGIACQAYRVLINREVDGVMRERRQSQHFHHRCRRQDPPHSPRRDAEGARGGGSQTRQGALSADRQGHRGHPDLPTHHTRRRTTRRSHR